MKMYVNTTNGGVLNMRDKADMTGAIVAKIPNGTQVDATTTDTNEWLLVTYGDKVGYCVSKFLAPESSSIDMTKLRKVYKSLQETLKLIEEVLE
jgi:uncharacterized protein YgiM (DUF1202 family)